MTSVPSLVRLTSGLAVPDGTGGAARGARSERVPGIVRRVMAPLRWSSGSTARVKEGPTSIRVATHFWEGLSRCRRFLRWWVPPLSEPWTPGSALLCGRRPSSLRPGLISLTQRSGAGTGPKHSVQYRRITETKDKLNVNLLRCQRQRRLTTELLDGRLDCTRNGEGV